MANRAIWSVRQKHEWLSTPKKGKPLKKRKRARIGMEAARLRKLKPEKEAPAT
ncbi:MAG TPA: hypothetical protein VHE30_09185 [Polyangiaceae bacterium]|nr:hypothetical protein [Polyangiaceae bacterium]